MVAARVKPDDKTDHLLLTPETEEVGPYQIPPPREVSGIETCELSILSQPIRVDCKLTCLDVPAYLNVPVVRRLATFVS